MDENTSYYCLEHFEKCLCSRIVPVFHEEFDKIYRDASQNRVLLPESLVIDNVQVAQYRNPILPRDFQDALCTIPVMNQTLIDKLYSKVCAGEEPFVSKLIQAIFAYSTQLACISSNVMPDSINISVPDGPHFIHSAFVTSARELWRNPLLLCVEGMSPYQKFKQHNKFQILLNQCVLEQVRAMLPTANILNNLEFGIGAIQENHLQQQQQQNSGSVDLRRQDLNHIMPSDDILIASSMSQQQPIINTFPQQPPMQEMMTTQLPATIPIPQGVTTTVTTAGPSSSASTFPVGMSHLQEVEGEDHGGKDSASSSDEDDDNDGEEDEEGQDGENGHEQAGENKSDDNPKVDQVMTLNHLPSRQNIAAGEGLRSSHNVIRIDTGI